MTAHEYWTVVEDEFACTHDTERVVFYMSSNKRKHYRMQCQRCGHARPVAKHTLLPQDRIEARPEDKALAHRWQSRKRIRIDELRSLGGRARSEDWWEWYGRYLRSEQWASKRERVLERDGHVCRACLLRPAEQVHHTTYDHVGNEPLFELVAVCRTCHDEITGMDRGQVPVGPHRGQIA